MTPAEVPQVSLDHVWAPQVSVAEEAQWVAARLQRDHRATFRELVARVGRLVMVARFLAVLELFRSGHVGFEQLDPLADLVLTWTGGDADEVTVSDDYEAAPKEDE